MFQYTIMNTESFSFKITAISAFLFSFRHRSTSVKRCVQTLHNCAIRSVKHKLHKYLL